MSEPAPANDKVSSPAPAWISQVPAGLAVCASLAALGAKVVVLFHPALLETISPLFPLTTILAGAIAIGFSHRVVRNPSLSLGLRKAHALVASSIATVAACSLLHLVIEFQFPDFDPLAHQMRVIGGVMGLAILTLGIAALPQKKISRGTWIAAGLDLATVLLTGFLGFWLYALDPDVRSQSLPTVDLGIIVAHVVCTLGLLSTLVLAYFRRSPELPRSLLAALTAGIILLVTAEIIPTCYTTGMGNMEMEPSLIGWALFSVVWGIAGRNDSRRSPISRRVVSREALTAIPFSATGLVGLLLFTSVVSREAWVQNMSILLPCVLLALILVVVRQTRIAQEKHRMALEMQAAKELAETANSSRLQFLANISHDLRTPLNGILGCAQILLREKNITPKQKELLKTSQSCAEHLRTMIGDLLDLSKLESGRLELAPSAFDLHAFVAEVIGSFRVTAETKNLVLEFVPAENFPRWIKCDRRRLHQILGNLIHNAIKFTNRGAVTLRVGAVDNNVVFAVRDTGCGILPDKLGDLFKPFYVVDEKSIQLEGTGLGLSISKRLAERMGGDITVASVYGKGSVFTLQLPLEEAAPVVEVQRTIVDYQGRRRRILIVDDNSANRIVLRSILEPLDFLIMEASSGVEALAQLDFAKPDILILDLMMPEMDGFELCRRVRALNLPSSPTCIALSAMAGEDVLDRCKAAGFAEWVRKPVQLESLAEALRAHAGIEWSYGLIKPGPGNSGSTETAEAPLKAPDPKLLETLTGIARRGNIRSFETHLSEAVTSDPNLVPFQERTQKYLSDFKLKELAEWLESLAPRTAA